MLNVDVIIFVAGRYKHKIFRGVKTIEKIDVTLLSFGYGNDIELYEQYRLVTTNNKVIMLFDVRYMEVTKTEVFRVV